MAAETSSQVALKFFTAYGPFLWYYDLNIGWKLKDSTKTHLVSPALVVVLIVPYVSTPA